MTVEDLETGLREQCAYCKARCNSALSPNRAVTICTCIVTLVAVAVVGALLLRTGSDIRQCTTLINRMQHDLRKAQFKIRSLETGLKNVQIKSTLNDLKHKIVSESDRSYMLLNELIVAINDDGESESAEASDKEYDNLAVPSSISVKSPKNNDSSGRMREPFFAEKTGYDDSKDFLTRLLLRQKRSDAVSSARNPQAERPKVTKTQGDKGKKNGKNKKQMRLPAIQLVGGGPVSPRQDKTDLKGLWHLDLVNPDLATSGVLKNAYQANNDGRIHIAKSGVYLMYAQLSIKKGFEVIKQTGYEKTVLMECYMDHMYNQHSTETCVSIRLYVKPDDTEDRIFIKEMEGAAGAVYGRESSVLGLIRIDDVQSLSALFE
ncbi:uncharacterized protein LOC127834192 isoform X2 [Dreissena polymorpha]|uniref:TNF family profile domain-containing protein n=1 Tax=Dreissena polymorpha TaxID=45954 RepID=A0A9D4FTL2_DREPO|nr:uncharacterized protein LOC127834192 isoform X2 [Dreissena polymorpha]KAH3804758.1 hypothetical protein DPMN_133046 [Dreissena polymorpha]